MQDYFFAIAEYLDSLLQGDEIHTCAFTGEDSDFVRFNHARVRQAGRVRQQSLTLELIQGRRHARGELTLAGAWTEDRARLTRLMNELRDICAQVPEDPWLLYATEAMLNEQQHPDTLPSGPELAAQVLEAGAGQDLVGILARGPVYAGFASSFGGRCWYRRPSFNLDWSLYLKTDKAVKSRYAGFTWDAAELDARMSAAAGRLETLARPWRDLPPGRYRAYLAPTALEEIMALLAWEGFSHRALRTGHSPLLRMVESGQYLHPLINLRENTAEGVAPPFQEAGFPRPDSIQLIGQGRFQDSLVSPRSAAEYGMPDNGAAEDESPRSLDLAGGELDAERILETLDTGLYLGNLWYLNWSDPNAARLTGMTRFATFWVEDGRIQAPVQPLRFDESLYRLLGDQLLGLTRRRELLLDPDSYGGRSSRSARLPGALVGEMTFTL